MACPFFSVTRFGSALFVPLSLLFFLNLAACAPRQTALAPTVLPVAEKKAVSSPAKSDSFKSDISLLWQIATADLELYESDDGDLEFTEELATPPSVYPSLRLIRPTASERITSPYGMRWHPTKHKKRLHAGMDISGKRGQKVVAAAAGKVVYSGRKGSYGLTVEIDAGKGVILRYAHLDKLGVKKGRKVKQGQYIGNLGRTGRVTAAHLHFEVRLHDKPVNPLQFIAPEHAWAVKTESGSKRKVYRN